jgi:two-component system OmpR family sensor kinase
MSEPTRGPVVTDAPAVDVTPGPADGSLPAAPTEELGDPAPRRRRSGPRRWVTGLPLRAQLVGLFVVLLVGALAATGYAVRSQTSRILVGQVDQQLRNSGPAVAKGVVLRLQRPDGLEDDGESGPPSLNPSSYITHVTLFNGYSKTVRPQTESALPAVNPTFPSVTAEQVAKYPATVTPFTLRSADGGVRWRAVALPVVNNLTGQTVGVVFVATPLTGVAAAVQNLQTALVVVTFAGALLFGGLGWLFVRRAFRPLAQVEETAAVIAGGDLSRRIPERPVTTEVGRLTASLNTMLSHIETAFRAREASEARTRRFAADASHELRTPLAAIRGFAELYRQGAVPADDVPRTMRRIEDEATRMGGLVEDLLLLARLDEQRPGRSEHVDLTVLAGDAVHDARGLDPNRPVQLLGLRPGAGPVASPVVGDEDRLRQVVANLVANAVRHTPPGTPVEVAVGTETDGGTVTSVLEVRDHGLGLGPEQAERIFERFYRLDSSRQRGKGGGSGLGLSIVAAVVTAHGGQVGVRTTPGGGATFRVALPAAAVDAERPGTA